MQTNQWENINWKFFINFIAHDVDENVSLLLSQPKTENVANILCIQKFTVGALVYNFI